MMPVFCSTLSRRWQWEARKGSSMSDEHKLGDGPVQAAYKEKMTAIIQTLDEFMNGEKKGADREVGTEGRDVRCDHGISRERRRGIALAFQFQASVFGVGLTEAFGPHPLVEQFFPKG
jgi:hypothetical protein